jgi:DinB family
MTSTVTPGTTRAVASPKQQFLDAYEKEHLTTMRVLRAYPADQATLKPHEKCKTALELAWVFVVERGLGTMVMHDAFASGSPPGEIPKPPASLDVAIAALDKAHADFGDLIRAMPEETLFETVKFFGGPKQLVDIPRLEFLRFLLCDEIHHRGQFSVYLRMAGAKVPSIYGPSADEPWS